MLQCSILKKSFKLTLFKAVLCFSFKSSSTQAHLRVGTVGTWGLQTVDIEGPWQLASEDWGQLASWGWGQLTCGGWGQLASGVWNTWHQRFGPLTSEGWRQHLRAGNSEHLRVGDNWHLSVGDNWHLGFGAVGIWGLETASECWGQLTWGFGTVGIWKLGTVEIWGWG